MHIPDNYLSPGTCSIFAAAMLPIWYYSLHKLKKGLPKDKLPLLGVGAAFAFLLMMFNLPIPGGTTAHAVGGTLLALLLGPYAACIALSTALFIQAVLFGDGGLLSFGVNAFNMAFILPFTGYYVYCLCKNWHTALGEKVAILIGAYAGINAAAFCAAVEFGLQPLLFTDAAGRALYCPYPLAVSVPVMMAAHLFIAGAAEAVFTLAIYQFILKTSPSFIKARQNTEINYVLGLLIVLILISPLGLIANGTAWGEWSADEIAGDTSFGSALGYIPAAIADGFTYKAALPDYSLSGVPDAVSYILSAIIGTAILIIIFKIIESIPNDSNKKTQRNS